MAKALSSFRQRRWLPPAIDHQRQQRGHSLLPTLPVPLVCSPLLPLQTGAWSNGYYQGKKRKNNIFSVTAHSPYSSHPSTARGTGRLIPSLSHLSPSLSPSPDLLLPAPAFLILRPTKFRFSYSAQKRRVCSAASYVHLPRNTT